MRWTDSCVSESSEQGTSGPTLARLLAAGGHDVVISNSRGPDSLAELVEAAGRDMAGSVRAGTVEEAAQHGELVIEAIPYGQYRSLPVAPLAGKILVSASNYYPGRDGSVEGHQGGDTELVAAHLPDTRVVKAFNTIYFEHLREQGDVARPVEERRVIFVAGDDAEARQVVADLVAELGFGPVDVGPLAAGRRLQPGSAVYNVELTAAQGRAALAG